MSRRSHSPGQARPRRAAEQRAAATHGRARGTRRRRLIDYPRSNRHGIARFVPSVKQVLGAIVLGVVAMVALFALAYALISVPNPNQFASAQTTVVYYADGETELGRFAAQNRVVIASSDIPQSVKDAVVAAEDHTFYENRGISLPGIIRALWGNLRGGGATQGGSTITQQYVKNYYLDSQRTYTRKAKEAIIALKIDQQQSKDEILANYLNTIYFGRGAYGIQTAAQAYFGKDAKDLTAQEGALLAGVIPNPSRWDPVVNPAKAQDRFDYVADQMVATGTLTQAQRDSWTMPQTFVQDKKDTYGGPNGYILAQVRSELTAAGLTERDLDAGGLRIVTTIDQAAQAAAVATIQDPDVFPTRGRPDTLRAALVSIDPMTGAITALYGGADYLVHQSNAVTQDVAQAGSTFKPFALVAGLEAGIGLRSTFNGGSGQTFKGYDKPIQNFGGASYGRIDLLTATANSVNTVYVALNQRVGPETTQEVAIRAGIPADTAGLNDYLGNVLGPSSPHPIDMATAYATFAARGERHTTHIVASATVIGSGKVVYTGPTAGTRVFDTDVMDDTNYALQQVVRRGSGSYAANLGRPVAGKTGTSSDNMSAWFIGYTPQLVTAVTLYNTDEAGNPVPIPGFGGRNEITGGSFPCRIWTSYMKEALQDTEELDFADPAWVGKSTGGRPSSSSSSSSRSSDDTETDTPTETGSATDSPSSEPSSPSSSSSSSSSSSTSPPGGSETSAPGG